MSDGWSIPVITRNVGGERSRQIYYARFDDRIDAEHAVKKHLGAEAELLLGEQTSVKGQVFDEMQVKQGSVALW